MQALRVQPCPGVAPELAWKYAGPFEKVGVPATLLACRHQQQEIGVCTGLFHIKPLSSPSPLTIQIEYNQHPYITNACIC